MIKELSKDAEVASSSDGQEDERTHQPQPNNNRFASHNSSELPNTQVQALSGTATELAANWQHSATDTKQHHVEMPAQERTNIAPIELPGNSKVP